MEDSPIGLDKWLMAMWQIVNCKNGISSYEVHRAIGVTQKTAWFLDHRIRFALGMTPGNKLSGQVEADETFIGGKARNMHAASPRRSRPCFLANEAHSASNCSLNSAKSGLGVAIGDPFGQPLRRLPRP